MTPLLFDMLAALGVLLLAAGLSMIHWWLALLVLGAALLLIGVLAAHAHASRSAEGWERDERRPGDSQVLRCRVPRARDFRGEEAHDDLADQRKAETHDD